MVHLALRRIDITFVGTFSWLGARIQVTTLLMLSVELLILDCSLPQFLDNIHAIEVNGLSYFTTQIQPYKILKLSPRPTIVQKRF